MAKQKLEIPVRVGDEVELEVESLASSGDGVSHHHGYTLFVPHSLPGDRVKAHVTKTTKRFGVTRVVARLHSTPDRVDAPCAVFPECGGCKIQDWDYARQMAFKVQQVQDALAHIGGLNIAVEIDPVPADMPLYYRNKANYAIDRRGRNASIGFYRQGTHHVVDHVECHTLMEPITHIKEWLRELIESHSLSIYKEQRHTGFLRGLVVRHSAATGEALVGLVTTPGEFSKKFLSNLTDEGTLKRFGIQGIVHNINHAKTNIILGPENITLWGQDFFREKLGELEFHLSLPSFFQVNPYQSVKLYGIVQSWVEGTAGAVLDAYCGNGGISLWLAKAGCEVVGIDSAASNIEDAEQSARLNGITTCRFWNLPLERAFQLKEELAAVKTVVIDPPRKGCSPEVVAGILEMKPDRIIYVSCNPATLARDLSLMPGYAVRAIKVIDMFPQTQHVEAAVLLERE
ncbi:23S rRNA (uracil(1939)-C(5))-methyltransferase RlmD [Nitrospina gracilis]|uniref:23S rRNA (uracil(1939)-C(5))-methyltransferase RlmD n=1 Tax=Nitrospina gracilis TaxID=35801 RepID=UPI001F0329A7|nr:23S rRNA (uracil(1939)-C(5))-methyltransferase RlmD [Nitrospina gracilis]MCF8720061.1 23S rRNA (uracil1939-C5)-methyltransferase [Nitrospina gracilis Nb-211]